MTIYEKIEKIEESIISLAGDCNSKGDYGKSTDKYVSKEKMEKHLKPRIKNEKLFLKQEVLESNIQVANYNETKKVFDKYTKDEKIETYEKVMYIATVKMMFTFIDRTTGEEISFQFSASANNNSNGGNAYGSAISYAVRNFYKTIFNITTGDKDEFKKDNIEPTIVPEKDEIHPLKFEKIDGKNKKEYYNSETGWAPLSEEDNPIGKSNAVKIAEELKRISPRLYEFKIQQIKTHFKIDKLEQLTNKNLKRLQDVSYDIDNLIKSYINKAV